MIMCVCVVLKMCPVNPACPDVFILCGIFKYIKLSLLSGSSLQWRINVFVEKRKKITSSSGIQDWL